MIAEGNRNTIIEATLLVKDAGVAKYIDAALAAEEYGNDTIPIEYWRDALKSELEEIFPELVLSNYDNPNDPVHQIFFIYLVDFD